ncbi:ABC transporter ATP-binding protein [Methanomassiliicoccus luminyensis]|uniref:ABC transporter ATP-binding protein n=2 Tax=Methanomassiliicoccus luminyensis TaxID=1080712 RepID=UPI0006744FE0|nr:ABC transporter ATP-binding protein [Methanomassiliicoccus luminyensis]
MLGFIRRMLKLSGEHGRRIKIAFVLSFFESMLTYVPVFAFILAFTKILDGSLVASDAWLIAEIMVGAVIARCILRRAFVVRQSGAGYEVCARERISIGDRLKRFPMSYFTEGNIGNITSAISIDLLFVEEYGMGAMDKVVNGYIGIILGCFILLIIDWRVALVSIAVFAAAMFVLGKIQRTNQEQSAIRQRQQARLTSAVLEYVQGISVIKSLNMSGERAQAIKRTIKETRDHAIDFEEKYTPLSTMYQVCFAVGVGLTVLATSVLCFNGSLNLSTLLVLVISIFYIYMPAQALASLSAQMRVMEAGLDRYEALKKVRIIDGDGKDIKLDRFDIEFKDVSFSYENNETLRDVSFKVPERSMTALVGASGSGKTTIANLIVRFWDVQQGEVLVGGVNVKRMTCDSLLKNISMVFQNVYLFNDTILNNIKFGRSDATFEEVVAAAKKARCHDFIMALEKGYDTMVGEGGGTLSGGERQRISIARAILKDAPIVLLDEATASVDPDNEKHIQQAINELVKDKTLVVIAHRLSTIRSADQILVIDEGRIVQRGTHAELVKQGGQYGNLWEKRQKARGWKISTGPPAGGNGMPPSANGGRAEPALSRAKQDAAKCDP